MDVRQQDVERIVVEVLKKMMSDQPTAAATTVVAASGCDCGDFGLFDRLEDAVQAAEAAQKKISTVAMRDKIIAAIRKAGLENAKAFAEIAHNETGMGRVSDKIAKNILVCERTPGTECLSPMAISGDMGLTLIENAPWGVIASVTPSTNPTATVINNAISMIAGGNSVIFAPHPNAKRASQTAIQVLNKAIIEATGVANLLVAVKEPTIEVAQELFSHPRIKLLVVTGGEAVVAQARKVATMRLIAAGAGNPPVVVDETANIARAARSIYDGASFDNNIICADEKEIIAVDSIADQLKAEMKAIGAVEISLEQADAVARVVLRNYPQVEGGKAPNPNPKWVGRDAALIAKAAEAREKFNKAMDRQGRRHRRARQLPSAHRGREARHQPRVRSRGTADARYPAAARRQRGRSHRMGSHPRTWPVPHSRYALPQYRQHGQDGPRHEHQPVRQERPAPRRPRRWRRRLDDHDHLHPHR